MRPTLWLLTFVCAIPFVEAQSPPSPAKLPASVMYGNIAPTPSAGTVPAAATLPAAPIAKFAKLEEFPPETVQAVFAMRAGADWLWRMNRPTGKFILGFRPALRTTLDAEDDVKQLHAARALMAAAVFTGDDKLSARAVQSILALMPLVKVDPEESKRRIVTTEKSQRVMAMSLLALSAYELPGADAKLLEDAEGLCRSLALVAPEEMAKTDPEGEASGLVLQAWNASFKYKPESWKREAAVKLITQEVGRFRMAPSTFHAANLIPGLVDFCLLNNKEKSVASAVYEMADKLVQAQNKAAEVRTSSWSGSYRPGSGTLEQSREPDFVSIRATYAVIRALALTRQVPDLARHRSYRAAAVEGLLFARTLQYSEENCDHFEKNFRSRFLNGGVHLSPSDATLRIDATAILITAHLSFLESGAEGKPE